MKRNQGLFKIYLAIVAVGLGLIVFAYMAVQQDIRISANMPQKQLAQDAADHLNAGATPSEVLPGGPAVDIKRSLAPFVVVTDKDMSVLASSVKLGDLPLPPKQAFIDAGSRYEGAFTWQPQAGVREAAVIMSYNGGYVLASRSLHEAERTIDNLTKLAILTVLGVLVVPALILTLLP